MASNCNYMICEICKQNFIDPRQLPCSHVFCFRCICSNISNKYKNFVCPRKDGTVIQQNQVDSLPMKIFANTNEDSFQDNGSTHPSDMSSQQNLNGIDSQNTIWVSGLPVNMSLDEVKQVLFDLFRSVGQIKINDPIKNVLAIYAPKGPFNKLKGYAYVTFEDEDSVERAITIYNGKPIQQLNGSKITVRINEPKNKNRQSQPKNDNYEIRVDGIPTNISDFELYRILTILFKDIGHIKFNPEKQKPSIFLSKGSARIILDNEDSVNKAIQTYNGQTVASLKNSKIFISRSQSEPPKPLLTPNNSNNDSVSISLSGLPRNMTERRLFHVLHQIFDQNGRIKINSQTNEALIEIHTDESESKKLIGTATITFKTEQSANEAIQKYDGQRVPILNDSKINLKKIDVTKKTNINLINKEKEIKDIKVWYLCEGFDVEATRVLIKSNADVHDLKQLAFTGKNDSYAYQAFFREKKLNPGETVPQDTTETQFVIFKKPSIQSNYQQLNIKQPRKLYHIIIDNSNIFLGAKTIRNNDGSTTYNPAIRVNVETLASIIKKGKFDILIRSKIVGGGLKKGIDHTRLIKGWETAQFRTMFVEITGKEVFVDNALCGEALQLITHNKSDDRDQQILVLATGDGNSNAGQLSFKRLVESALLENWNVELWSWKNCLHKSYLDFQQTHSNQFTIQYLDPFRKQITFIQTNQNNNENED